MRRYIAVVNNEPIPEPVLRERNPLLVAYEKEFRPYKRKSTYVVPLLVITYDNEQKFIKNVEKHRQQALELNARSEKEQASEYLDIPNLYAGNLISDSSYDQINSLRDELISQAFRNSVSKESLTLTEGIIPWTISVMKPETINGIMTGEPFTDDRKADDES